MIKRILFKSIILAALLMGATPSLIFAGGQSAAVDMLSDLEIPLMDGLLEDSDERMVFDSPEGRIILAQASGQINSLLVYNYYKVVLPSLSWEIIDVNNAHCEAGASYCLTARRDQENLNLSIKTNQKKSIVIYSLSPL